MVHRHLGPDWRFARQELGHAPLSQTPHSSDKHRPDGSASASFVTAPRLQAMSLCPYPSPTFLLRAACQHFPILAFVPKSRQVQNPKVIDIGPSLKAAYPCPARSRTSAPQAAAVGEAAYPGPQLPPHQPHGVAGTRAGPPSRRLPWRGLAERGAGGAWGDGGAQQRAYLVAYWYATCRHVYSCQPAALWV